MNKSSAIKELKESLQFFENSTKCLSEDDSTFSPQEGLMTVAQQVAHMAQTVDWFISPLETGDPFNLDFEGMQEVVLKITSYEKALDWLRASISKN